MAVNLAVAAGEHDRRVLVVDVDLQADVTTMLGVDPTPSPQPLMLAIGIRSAGGVDHSASRFGIMVEATRSRRRNLGSAGRNGRYRSVNQLWCDACRGGRAYS
ncbi:MAG: hypothetical protein M3N47_03915 [Chloroflexota bacterium]|nr:hypothetical protein [Chloroflexota bacterium]